MAMSLQGVGGGGGEGTLVLQLLEEILWDPPVPQLVEEILRAFLFHSWCPNS